MGKAVGSRAGIRDLRSVKPAAPSAGQRDDHTIMGGNDVIGRFGIDPLVVHADMHVGQNGPLPDGVHATLDVLGHGYGFGEEFSVARRTPRHRAPSSAPVSGCCKHRKTALGSV